MKEPHRATRPVDIINRNKASDILSFTVFLIAAHDLKIRRTTA